MDRYIEGILHAYNKVLETIDILDKNHENDYLNMLRKYIDTYKYGYELEIDHIQNYEDETKGFKNYLNTLTSYVDTDLSNIDSYLNDFESSYTDSDSNKFIC